ncbi:protein PIMREG-like isoform X1 [Hemiscyllium ocellatum]|uniref:protein PIMREG-like isoform X1 n=1 Tax=Hemiscyllium ocellatum TaxID=170820 RepID=UPI00296679B7|nr:protein PIMREG-like isoform X1 [Hemiscyllium ocellatum]
MTTWRKQHQILQEEGDSPPADLFREMSSSSSLNTIRMSLRKRLPLGQMDFNIDHTPSWESLELSKKPNALQSIGRTARNTWGNVSQKLQKKRQSRSESLVITPSKSQTPQRCSRVSASKKGTPSKSHSSRKGRTSATPSSVNHTPKWREVARLLDQDGLPLRRSVRSAALKSPYASPTGISRRRQFDCDLESVSFGIRRLKRLSQVFDEAITKEERKQTIENYHHIMSENMRLSKIQGQKMLASSFRRKAKRLRFTISRWADVALSSIAEQGKSLN